MRTATTRNEFDQWVAQLEATHPEIIHGTPERTKARKRWHPVYQRVYGIRPWEIGRYTIRELHMIHQDLEKHGLGSGF